MNIYVVSVGYNCQKYVSEWYNSLQRQLIPFKVFVAVDDLPTYHYVEALKCKRITLMPFEKTRGYAAYNRWQCLQEIKNLDDGIVVQLDLDDGLIANSLPKIRDYYIEHKKRCVIGSSFNTMSGQRMNQQTYNTKTMDNNKFIDDPIFKCPPTRTFHTSLIKELKEDDFKIDGEWIKMCTDVALFFSIFDKIHNKELGILPEKTYLYRDKRPDSTFGQYKQLIFQQLKAKWRK